MQNFVNQLPDASGGKFPQNVTRGRQRIAGPIGSISRTSFLCGSFSSAVVPSKPLKARAYPKATRGFRGITGSLADFGGSGPTERAAPKLKFRIFEAADLCVKIRSDTLNLPDRSHD
jgi:hypothetical protein